jgi:FkbM family methyltransferase
MFNLIKKFLKKIINNNPYSEKLGENGDIYNVCLQKLNSKSIILSFGVGNIISFEKELTRIKNCKIYLFDPTPASVAFMSQNINKHPNLIFTPIGIANNDLYAFFKEPDNSLEGSWKKGDESNYDKKFKCTKLSSLLKKLDFENIDLLKMDIEGFEYEVLDEIFNKKIYCNQIIVEFHTKINRVNKTKKTILSVLKYVILFYWNDYRLVNINKSDFLFIKKNLIK